MRTSHQGFRQWIANYRHNFSPQVTCTEGVKNYWCILLNPNLFNGFVLSKVLCPLDISAGWKKKVYGALFTLVFLNKEISIQSALRIRRFHTHGFNLPHIKSIWEKKFQKVPKSKTWICHVLAAIYIAFTLCYKL